MQACPVYVAGHSGVAVPHPVPITQSRDSECTTSLVMVSRPEIQNARNDHISETSALKGEGP